MRRAALALLLLVAACGGATKDAVLVRTMAGVNAARDAFTTWDGEHQHQIVEQATTKEEGQTLLAMYRGQRAKVTLAFVAAYGALAAASIDGTAESFIAASSAATALLSALRDLGMLSLIGKVSP